MLKRIDMNNGNFYCTWIAIKIEFLKIIKSYLIEAIVAAYMFLITIKGGNNWSQFSANSILLISSVIGLTGFGILSSWVFAREYIEGTFKDLLALPISRTAIIIGKYIAIEFSEFIILLSTIIISLLVGIAKFNLIPNPHFLSLFFGKILLAYSCNACLSFLWPLIVSKCKSLLLPISLSLIALIVDVIFASRMVGQFIPWSIPGYLLAHYGSTLLISHLIIALVTIVGIDGTIIVWNKTDQK